MTGTEWAGLAVAIGVPTIAVIYGAGRLSRAVDDLTARVASIERWIQNFGTRRR